jgi:c-di-AMP phosphodiesterase-like protein
VARLSAASIDLLMQELVSASPIRNFSEKIGGFFRRCSRIAFFLITDYRSSRSNVSRFDIFNDFAHPAT